MRITMLGSLAIVLLLCGCGEKVEDASEGGQPKGPGRYAGIGVFTADALWAQMTDANAKAPADPAVAKIADDEHIIVVLDSHTGEVRQCGDHSGYCVAMNPWTGARATLPVKLTKHLSDLEQPGETATPNAGENKKKRK